MDNRLYLGGLFLAHATCSVSMVLLNKTIAQGFDFPWTVLLIQNIGTVVIGYLEPCLRGSRDKANAKKADEPAVDVEEPDKRPPRRKLFGMKVPRKTKNRLWVVLQVAFFMGTLFTSLKALRFISVPLYVVARNTVPAQTALLERVFTSVRLSASAVAGLMCTILGAVIYTYGDLKAGLAVGGLAYAVVLTLIVSGCSIIDKTVVRILGQEEDIRPVECNQIRVALALPVNLLFVAAFDTGYLSSDASAGPGDEKPQLYASFVGMSYAVQLSLLLSTLFGFGMGTFNFCLQQAVSAATVQVANILWKLSTTLISLVTHPAPVAGISWLGYAVSLTGIALYTFAPKIGVSPSSKDAEGSSK
mmetsp:Transcript_9430/g.19004  ORF Transcript_9430/g.19004 Transcript_9430/m.19004 type:complete len:360 (-) Transcript_9430:126-1205(-)